MTPVQLLERFDILDVITPALNPSGHRKTV